MYLAFSRLLVLSVVVCLSACTSTTFTSTWKSPDAGTIDPSGKKVAAVFISTDESSRREAEDVLARKLTEQGATGVPAYSIIPSEELRNMEGVKARLTQAGVDGVVTMRVIDEREKTTVRYDVPRPAFAPYYWNFTGYWGHGWGAPYVPTEVRTDTLLRIETLVYSLDRNTLLWTGTSRTVNPDRISDLVSEVADTATKQMVRQGVLKRTE
jgi:hypothetical protein